MAELLEVPVEFMSKMPSVGNTETISVLPTPIVAGDEPTEEQRLAAAEAEIAARNKGNVKSEAEIAKEKAEKDKTAPKDELTDDQVQAKLDELGKKDEKGLTADEKAFIQKYVPEDTDDEINSIKKDFETTYGIQLGEKYDNNADGLKALATEVAPKLAERIFMDSLENVPYMRDFYQHVALEGKSIETFLAKNSKPEFESIEIKSLGDLDDSQKPKMLANLKQLIAMDMSSKGVAEEDINNLVALYEANGTLFDKGKGAKDSLSKAYKASIDSRIKAEEAQIQAQKVEQENIFKQIDKIITTNSFNGSQIPPTDVKPFKDAMLKTIDNQGITVMDIKRSQLTLEQRALLDYIIFKDFKVTGLATKAQVSKVFQFKKANEENNSRKGGRTRGGSADGGQSEVTSGHPSFSIGNIDFNKLNAEI